MIQIIKVIRNSVCILICISLVALCGCNKQQSISTVGGADAPKLVYESILTYASHGIGDQNTFITNSLNFGKMSESKVSHLPIFKFESKEELSQFKATILKSYNLDSSHNDVPSFNSATLKYDDNHFEEKTILLVCIPATSGSVRHYVKNIDIENENLCVSVGVNSPNTVTMDLVSWFIVISIDKKAISNVSSFDAVYFGG
ncbi:MAG: hypothetical protein IJN93_03405 [Clostridia bacterium]|nr:hypothetical protein [Clostridia bacterium]